MALRRRTDAIARLLTRPDMTSQPLHFEVEGADAAPLPQHVAVVGAGLMGAGIAQCVAQIGIPVVMQDVAAGPLARGFDQIRQSLERLDRAGRLRRPPADVLELVSVSEVLHEAVAQADLVIEAVPERLDLKREVFSELCNAAPEHAILATNTSQCSITAIAAATKAPQRVVGLHFFNPPPVMAIVEVIPGLETSQAALRGCVALVTAMGKEPTVAKDVAGFVASRGSVALLLEGQRMYEEGVASAEDIDATFRLGFGHPMGPLELADYVGLDTVLAVAENMRAAHGERFRPPSTLCRLVAAGHAGRKTGRGFYDYSDPRSPGRG